MKLIRIDLTEMLGVGQFVEIRDPKVLPWGEQRKLLASMADSTMQSQIVFAEKLVMALIRNGYVIDEEDQSIPFPLSAEDMDRLPAQVVDAVSTEFTNSKTKGADVPKK